MQKGLEGTPELLIDPNTFSADSTSQLAEFALSKDGKYFAYGISQGGSDWRDVHVMEIAGRKTLPDLLKWVKVSDIAWQGNGFYYSRYDAPAQGKELTSSNDDHKVGTNGPCTYILNLRATARSVFSSNCLVGRRTRFPGPVQRQIGRGLVVGARASRLLAGHKRNPGNPARTRKHVGTGQ